MNGEVPRWIEVREALRSPAPPLGEPGSVERLKQKIQEAYVEMMVRPPTPVVGGSYVAARAKVGYQWESLAMHYFHGSHVLPSSLINPPTTFGQAVGRALLGDFDGTTTGERLGQCLEHAGARGLGSVAALETMWRAYLRHLERKDLGGAMERCLDLKRSLNVSELQRLNAILNDDAPIGLYDDINFAARAATLARLLEQAQLQIDRMLDFVHEQDRIHPRLLAEAMRNCLVPLNEEVDEATREAEKLAGLWKAPKREPRDMEALAASEIRPVMPKRRSKGLQRPDRMPEPVTDGEHAENRAFWLVEAERASHEGAAEEVKLATGRSKNYDKTNLQVAFTRVRKLVATGHAWAQQPKNDLDPRLKFLAQISLEVS